MSEHGNFSSFKRGYGGGRLKPDHGNRHYVRRGRGRGGSAANPLDFPAEVNIKKGLDTSKVIEMIPAPPHPSAVEDIPVENVQYVASYNWVDKEQPTIVVPGTSFSSPLERFLSLTVLPMQVPQLCGPGAVSHSPWSPTEANTL